MAVTVSLWLREWQIEPARSLCARLGMSLPRIVVEEAFSRIPGGYHRMPGGPGRPSKRPPAKQVCCIRLSARNVELLGKNTGMYAPDDIREWLSTTFDRILNSEQHRLELVRTSRRGAKR